MTAEYEVVDEEVIEAEEDEVAEIATPSEPFSEDIGGFTGEYEAAFGEDDEEMPSAFEAMHGEEVSEEEEEAEEVAEIATASEQEGEGVEDEGAEEEEAVVAKVATTPPPVPEPDKTVILSLDQLAAAASLAEAPEPEPPLEEEEEVVAEIATTTEEIEAPATKTSKKTEEAEALEAAMAEAVATPAPKPSKKSRPKKAKTRLDREAVVAFMRRHPVPFLGALVVCWLAGTKALLFPSSEAAEIATIEYQGRDEFSAPEVRRTKPLSVGELRQREASLLGAPTTAPRRGNHAFLRQAAVDAVPGVLVREGQGAAVQDPRNAPTRAQLAQAERHSGQTGYGAVAPAREGGAIGQRRQAPAKQILIWEEGDSVVYEARREVPKASGEDRELGAPLGKRIRVRLLSSVRSGQKQSVVAKVTQTFAPGGRALLQPGDKLVGTVGQAFEERVEVQFTKAVTKRGNFKFFGWAQQGAKRGIGGEKKEIDTAERVSSAAVAEGINVVGEVVGALTPAEAVAKAAGRAVTKTVEATEEPEERRPTAEVHLQRGTRFEVEVSLD